MSDPSGISAQKRDSNATEGGDHVAQVASKVQGKADGRRRGFRLRWGPVEKFCTILGGLAALAAIITATSGVFSHDSKPRQVSKLQREVNMVAKLLPGESYGRLSAIVGVPANYEKKLPSGNKLYQYERPWEAIQFVVNPDGKVLSVGIFAKTNNFHAHAGIPGATVVLGKTPVSRSLPGVQPDRANAYCGAHQAAYLEAYDNLPMAYGLRGLAAGVINGGDEIVDASLVCTDLGDVCFKFPLPFQTACPALTRDASCRQRRPVKFETSYRYRQRL